MLLLNPERSILAITNQSIRDLAKRALARLFAGKTICSCCASVRRTFDLSLPAWKMG
jgi:hypothetical protein